MAESKSSNKVRVQKGRKRQFEEEENARSSDRPPTKKRALDHRIRRTTRPKHLKLSSKKNSPLKHDPCPRPASSGNQPHQQRGAEMKSTVTGHAREEGNCDFGGSKLAALAHYALHYDFLNPATQKDTPAKIVRQPETGPISLEQLLAEVKGIYARLALVEGNCIQLDAKQVALDQEAFPGTQPKLNNEEWQALVALHRSLLHEHHNFFWASPHPSAAPVVRKLAIKYDIPARLWRHGIHSFLELLRSRLPDSLDHMLTFIYLAYGMMTLLYETVPAFEETWIEYLGDLSRYRMAIEEAHIGDKKVWAHVARQWYIKASNRSPETGKFYHHLGTITSNAVEQLFLYQKALSVSYSFPEARKTLSRFFEKLDSRRLLPVTAAYIRIHAIISMGESEDVLRATCSQFYNILSFQITTSDEEEERNDEQGFYIAISNCIALEDSSGHQCQKLTENGSTSRSMVKEIQQLFTQTARIYLKRIINGSTLSFLHVTLVYLSYSAGAREPLEGFPWLDLVIALNILLRCHQSYDSNKVVITRNVRILPEEIALRGFSWAKQYLSFLPNSFYAIKDDSPCQRGENINLICRPERIIWLGQQLARSGKWITYSEAGRIFSLPSTFPGHINVDMKD